MLKIIFVLLLINLVKINSTSLRRQDDFTESSKDVTTLIKEVDEWLTKVIPVEWLNCTKYKIAQPPKDIEQCINNTIGLMSWDSRFYTNRSECCFKWDIVDCWINTGIKEHCLGYYGETMNNALINKSNMKNCESKDMEFGAMHCHADLSGLAAWIIWAFVITGIILFIIILLCVCCFWAAIVSCFACCLCLQ